MMNEEDKVFCMEFLDGVDDKWEYIKKVNEVIRVQLQELLDRKLAGEVYNPTSTCVTKKASDRFHVEFKYEAELSKYAD